MLLSIIVINYNTFELTSKCLRSIYHNTKSINFEIILVDNASIERSPEDFLLEFSQIKLIQSDRNLGFSGGNNLGIKESNGEYILLLNSDTEFTDNSLERALTRIVELPSVGVLTTMLTYPSGEIQHVCGAFPSFTKELYEFFRLQRFLDHKTTSKQLSGFYFNHLEEREVDWIWGTFFLMRKEVLLKFKDRQLPQRYFMYFEDTDWCYEIKKLGYKIYYYPSAQAIHHLSASSKEIDKEERKAKKCLSNEYDFLSRNYGTLYAKVLFFVRAVKFFSARTVQFNTEGKMYLKFLFNRNI